MLNVRLLSGTLSREVDQLRVAWLVQLLSPVGEEEDAKEEGVVVVEEVVVDVECMLLDVA